MTISSQLVVPMTLWGKIAPTHCMSSVFITKDQKMIVTGCKDGQICVWDIVDGAKIVPRSMLFGHTGPVLCLASASPSGDGSLLVSSSEAGEMSLWDLTDGRCLENTKLPYVHTHMQSHSLSGSESSHLFCNGYYADVVVLDTMTLTVAFELVSRVSSDWISAMHVIRTPKRNDDVVVAISACGMAKVWTLSPEDYKSSSPLYEDESKTLKCMNTLCLACCAYNQRTILVVTAKCWHIYDAYDFALLCSTDNRPGERWMGGDFISADRVCVWSDKGRGYLYQLPANKLKGKAISAIADSREFRTGPNTEDNAFLFCVLAVPNDERLVCPPAMGYFLGTRGGFHKVLLRGDSNGRVVLWNVVDVAASDVARMRQEVNSVVQMEPFLSLALQEAWDEMKPPPPGILDKMELPGENQELKLTASVYLPLQGRLVVGREDGSIVVVSATQAVMLQLLYGKHHHDDRPQHQLLHGHNGRVTCLLYPNHVHSRYEIAHLVSGGVDFSVCLWDLYAGTLLHRFCVHAGEVTQLLVPPSNCSTRVLQSICSVASDHSVALVSLKERKCIMLASRHLFPVGVVKWRPFDDFMVVGCSDGSVYVWQMETGHLDRVLQGLAAEEVLSACDEYTGHPGERMTNPAVHLFRGLRHRNMAAIRHAAQRGLHQLQQQHHSSHHPTPGHQHGMGHDVGDSAHARSRAHPLMIQGLRTNPVDQDSHVLFFDIEALIGFLNSMKEKQRRRSASTAQTTNLNSRDMSVLLAELKVQLLSEEYSGMSPGTLESQGLINQSEYQKYLTLSSSPETHKKLSGFIAKVKDTAETAASKIQAKAESVGIKTSQADASGGGKPGDAKNGVAGAGGAKHKHLSLAETNLTMEIAQLLLSLLHAWGLDNDLDKACEGTLGLLCPMRPICFGLLSRGSHMSLLLPTHTYRMLPPSQEAAPISSSKERKVVTMPVPKEQIEEEERARRFSSRGHWELSTAVTTNHLLSVIALANTLMSMNSATFVPDQEKRRKLHRRLSRADSRAFMMSPGEAGGGGVDGNAALAAIQEALSQQQAHVKQGWSLLAAMHCVLLPDHVRTPDFKRPQVEMLARRWQDRCLEVREAAQALLLAELRRIGPKGRKMVVDEWAVYLPNYGEAFLASPYASGGGSTGPVPQAGQTAQQTPNAAGLSTVAIEGNVASYQVGSAVPSRASSGGSTPSGPQPKADTQSIRTSDGQNSSEEEDEEEREGGEATTKHAWSAAEARRKQSTAIVLLGVIGAEYGHEIEQSKRKGADDQKKKSVVDGFGPTNYSLAWHTSQALAYLLLTPASPSLPAHTSLRRAAIDLIGRGFTVWQAHMDVSRVLLGLLELCCDSDKLVPSMSYGLPLTPAADSCRTARHALSLIATARPPTFITTLAREVHRYNTLAQNAQSLNISLHQTVLSRARPEILRIVELLIDKMQTEVADLLVEVMEIVLHCLDHTQLKMRGLNELFPAICRFHNVSYCGATRRIAVGAKSGNLTLYELRASKSQIIPAHSTSVVACAFSPDGKYLATYSSGENKLCFWQTAAGLFGLGNAQTRCVRTYPTPPLPDSVRANPLKMAQLVWISSRTVTLMLTDGSEHRFTLS
ncbi:WD repeat-containing protein 7 isoform X2 [Dermacentor silvarum]|uniref:WD repeat-containing protein 7 isoform X2 n=1 Tax=Dermacentor silvarum TaxID=543639 RepID=UPI0021009A13|nr:WD repeat-containing protein 7 isoform X2 [Dermacentor silvarum]